jgi:hypothetical protein
MDRELERIRKFKVTPPSPDDEPLEELYNGNLPSEDQFWELYRMKFSDHILDLSRVWTARTDEAHVNLDSRFYSRLWGTIGNSFRFVIILGFIFN